MSQPFLNYYNSLAPYRKLFQEGVPILMYHRLGRSLPGARLKSLTVSRSLFNRQMAELGKAGFSSASLDELLAYPGQSSPARFVVTFDDGFANVFENGLDILRDNHVTAMQFLVPGLIGKQNEWDVVKGDAPLRLMDVAQVREWIAAGHAIGAHTMTHPNLRKIGIEQAREEITASKKTLEDLFGVPIRHFCYPYGSWDEKIVAMVHEAGFESACTTELGVNTPSDNPLYLKRITARYLSRTPRDFLGSAAYRIADLFRRSATS